MLYSAHLVWARFELTTLVVIGTDCTGSCKSNYYTNATTTAPGIKNRLLKCTYISNECILFHVYLTPLAYTFTFNKLIIRPYWIKWSKYNRTVEERCNTCSIVSEWLLLNTKEQFFSYIVARTSYIQWNTDNACFVQDQRA